MMKNPVRTIRVGLSFGIVRAKIGALRTAARLLGMRWAARWLVARLDRGKIVSGRPTILCLQRPLFSKDIDEMRRRCGLNLVCLNNEFLGHLQTAWVSRAISVEAFYQRARGPEFAAEWGRLRRFGDILLDELAKTVPVDAVLAAHIDYWQGEGVRLAAQARGLPFLVLCREHMNLPHEQETVRKFYTGFAFEGDGVAVFGESTRRIFIESGACAPEQVVVTGPPRLDVWHDLPTTGGERHAIVLLSYRDPDYFAPRSFADVLAIFAEEAARAEGNRDVRFVVKAKNRDDQRHITRMIPSIPANLTIAYDLSLFELFPRSRLVVGFNSLAVVEALLTDAAVVVPHWGDACIDPDWLMFHPGREGDEVALLFARSAAQLREVIQAAANAPPPARADRGARDMLVDRLIAWSPGRSASSAVEQWLRDMIGRGRPRPAARPDTVGGAAPAASPSRQNLQV